MLLSRLYVREELNQLLFTYALVLIISDFAKIIWGTGQLSVARPAILKGAVPIMGQYFPEYNIFVILLGLGIAVLFWLVLSRTRWGRIIRAAALDREMIGSLGINVNWLFTLVFVIGSWLAGLGGALVAPIAAIVPGMDMEIIISAFIVVVVGGLGSFWGTLLGALILGQVIFFRDPGASPPVDGFYLCSYDGGFDSSPLGTAWKAVEEIEYVETKLDPDHPDLSSGSASSFRIAFLYFFRNRYPDHGSFCG